MAYDPVQKFKEFIGNTANIERAKNIRPSRGMVLLDIFIYRESTLLVTESGAIDTDGKRGNFNYWPIAKVLAVNANDTEYKPGDLVKINNDLCATPKNRTARRNAIIEHNKHYPGEYEDPGPIWEGGIADTMVRYNLPFNPLSETEREENTKVLIPSHLIECILDKELVK